MRAHIEDIQAIYRAALSGVSPGALLASLDLAEVLTRPLNAFRRVHVVGAGKASMAMAGTLEPQLGSTLAEGTVVVPHGYPDTFPAALPAPRHIEVLQASHPVPDAAGAAAARRALDIAAACEADDLLLVLISGGGSALWSIPADGLSLDDLQQTNRLLLRSGATIHQINTVRKHLSQIAGGRLAARAHPATVLALVVSDVVGDDLDVIASGPTVPDLSTFADALHVVEEADLMGAAPAAVVHHLHRGLDTPTLETPKPGDVRLRTSRTVLLGSNRHALEAARRAAEQLGYQARVVTDQLVGEAREVGQDLAETIHSTTPDQPTCLLWGGETTVTVRGDGRGGRNQELALAVALGLDGADHPAVFLSGGTDGIDGPTDAAGAWVTHETVQQAQAQGLEANAYLSRNDAYAFFDALGQLLKPGPTHTNVMDVQIALMPPR